MKNDNFSQKQAQNCIKMIKIAQIKMETNPKFFQNCNFVKFRAKYPKMFPFKVR